MILDEAIERENALAYSYGERYKRLGEPVGDLQELEAEHRQMAEWLRELQKYREMLKNEPQIREDVLMYMIREMKQNDTIRSNK